MRRSVHFNVDASGKVDKRIPQFGGVRGEHHATKLVFTMAATAPYQEGDLVRLRFTCGDGSVLSSDLVENVIVQGDRMLVEYTLPSVLTQAGGQLGVRVVFSRVDEDGRETEMFLTDEAVLYFEDSASENGTPFWTGVSEMLKRTATASDTAVAARDAAIAEKHEAAASAQSASRYADAARTKALEAVSSEQNAQLFASAALSHRDDAETARDQSREMATLAGGNARKAEEAADRAEQAMAKKLDKEGYPVNKYLGTDENGRVVPKDITGGGASVEDVKEAVSEYLDNNPVKGFYVGEGPIPKGYNARINPNGKTIPFNPTPKTEAMTVPVGIDPEGRLWAEPTDAPVYEEWKGGAY